MMPLLVLLTAHFVGDFLCQSDRMALNKSKSWDVLAWHVSVYTVVIAVASLRLVPLCAPWGLFVTITFVTHFATDAVTSRITSRLWFLDITASGDLGKIWREGTIRTEPTYCVEDRGTRHWFFVVIGVDQLIHAWTLGLTLWAVHR